MRRKSLALFFVLLITCLVWSIIQVGADDPIIEISSADDLAKIGVSSDFPSNGHYKLMNDIDLTNYDTGNGEGWKPLTYPSDGFEGIFDGNDKEIIGMTIHRTSDNNGLFTYINEQGVVKDLTLSNVSIKNTGEFQWYAGALAGINRGKIENVHIDGGSIDQEKDSHIGGLVGINHGDIINSTARVNVTGHSYIGGLVGQNTGNLSNVSASGKVSGIDYVGGLVGAIKGLSNDGGVSEAIASGDVEGRRNVGGLIGLWEEEHHKPDALTIMNTSALGHVTGEASVGGLIGNVNSLSTSNIVIIRDSHATGHVHATANNVGGLIGYSYSKTNIEDSSASGNVEGVENVGGLVGSGFYDINGSWASGEVLGHSNIGGLIGTITGRSTITNTHATGKVTAPSSDSKAIGGLIGKLEQYGTVNNSYASGHVSSGGSMVGGLIGQLNDGDVNHSYATGDVTSQSRAGGLVGYMTSSNIKYGIATGTVRGGDETGGLIGYLVNSSVQQSFASGDVIGKIRVGGLVGYSIISGSLGSDIQYSAAFGPVTGSKSVGGLVGGLSGMINHSYATGDVQSDGPPDQDSFGGLVGEASRFGHVHNSYATGQVDGGTANYVGGLIGNIYDGGIHTSYATGDVYASGNDVGGYLGLHGYSINSGYYTGNVSAGGNNHGVKLTSSELKQQNKLSGFSFITPSAMNHPWMIVPGVTNPMIRNPGAPSVPSIQMSASMPSITVDIGDTVNLEGTVALSHPETYHLVPDAMKPLYLYCTIQNEDGDEIKTALIETYANPQEIESFSTSIFIDSNYESDKTYKINIWAISVRGGATYYEDSFTITGDPELELNAIVNGGAQYKEGDWTSQDVTVTAHFSFDNPSQRQYVILDQPIDDVIDIDDLTGWEAYNHPITLNTSGDFTVFFKTGNTGGVKIHQSFIIRIDKEAPTDPIIQAEVSGSNGWEKGVVSVEVSEGIDTLSGVDYSEYRIGDGVWIAFQDSEQLVIEDEGITTVYARTYDKVGNIRQTEQEVKIDLTAPATPTIDLDGVDGKDGWANDTVTITLTSGADTLSGVDYSEYKIGADGNWEVYVGEIELDTEGVVTVYARTFDKAGNISAIEAQEVKIDLTAPASPTIDLDGVDGKDGWANDTVTITLTSGTDTLSGVDYSEYKMGADGIWKVYVNEIEVETEGVTTVYARTYDKAGNTSDIAIQEVKIDLTPPASPTIELNGADGEDGWFSGTVTVSILDGSDPLSDVDQTEYKIDVNGTWEIYTGAFEIENEGVTTIYARTYDKAGHLSVVEAYEEVKVDLTAPAMPTIQLTGADPTANVDSWLDGPIEVEIINGIDDLSGVDYTEYKINDENWIKYTASFEIDDAYKTTLTARTIDKAGNISEEVIREITIESKRPAPPMPSGVERLVLANNAEGTLSFDQVVTVTIPAGSTDQLLIMTIEEVTAEFIPANTDADKLVSGIYEILKNIPEDFNKDISITLAFDPSKISENQMPSVFYFDESLKEWINIGGTQDGNKITVQVDHLTKFAVFAVNIEDEASSELHLTDIEGHWAEKNIALGVQKGFINGYPDHTFRPERYVTRAEFIVMLMKAMNDTGSPIEILFTDQSLIGPWAINYIAQAQKAGIIQGYDDGSFRPNNYISRTEMSVMIANALKQEAQTVTATHFADDHHIPIWAKMHVETMRRLGIISGRGNNMFVPNDHATRAEAVTVILNWLEYKAAD